MAKKVKVASPELGLIDPNKPTEIIELVNITPETEKFLNDVSKLSNHTISSVVTILLSIQIINFGSVAKTKTKTRAKAKK